MKRAVPWLRVFAEGFVIVSSILLAFGIDAWWDDRGERVRERQYLERLLTDLERTEASLTSIADLYERQLSNGQAALDVLQGRALVPEDTIMFLAAVFHPTRQSQPRVSRATYDDLISTGSLDVIQDASLRDSIMTYFESVDARLFPTDYELDGAPYRRVVRSIIPPAFQFELQRCDATPQVCSLPKGAATMSAVTDAILAEPGIARQLTLLLQSKGIRTFDFAIGATVDLQEAVRGAFEPD